MQPTISIKLPNIAISAYLRILLVLLYGVFPSKWIRLINLF